ncbi:MAG: LysM peptidoglycan-binding domain-containing protein [Pseudorhodobacter sp.]|nr:LysM peptidoglycan-binding domain-containing protein [Pseudorhodobacter sp.]
MTVWNETGTGTKAAVGVAAVVLVAVIGWLVWQPVPVPEVPVTEPVTTAAPEAAPDVAEVVTEPNPEPAPEPAAIAAPEATPSVVAEPEAVAEQPTPPTFDTVRVEADGSALVAGRAGAGALVSILVDGAEVTTATANARGGFAALFNLAPSATPRLLTLMMTLADGTRLRSSSSVALAPVAAPLAVAEVPPEAMAAAPEPVAELATGPAPAPVAPTALLLSEVGAQVLQSGDATPAKPEIVSIDTITYTADGAVQLAGRGRAGEMLRLYLDNTDLATLTIAEGDAWAVTLPEVMPGLYTLRADQLNTAGKVTSRFETPFKRETLEALAAVTAPEAAAVEVVATAPATAAPTSAEPLADQPEAAETVAGVAAALDEPAVADATPAPAAAAPAEPIVVAPIVAAPAVEAPAAEVAIAEPAAPVLADAAPAPAPAPVAPASEAKPQPAAPPPPLTVTVQPGFTLWRIARENYGHGIMYVQVFEANRDKIRNPDLIYPGQVFAIPTTGN